MAVPSLVEPRITGCCSKRGTGGRQGGHSRLYIGSIAAWAMIGCCVDGKKGRTEEYGRSVSAFVKCGERSVKEN